MNLTPWEIPKSRSILSLLSSLFFLLSYLLSHLLPSPPSHPAMTIDADKGSSVVSPYGRC